MSKALSWCAIKAEDGAAFRSDLLFLQSCYNTMSEIDDEDQLENASNMRVIVSKLPFKLRDNWKLRAEEQALKISFTSLRGKHVVFWIGEANIPVNVDKRVKVRVQQWSF